MAGIDTLTREQILAMPKAEIHVHAEATLEAETLLTLAERNERSLPYETVEEVREAYRWTNLSEFLAMYYANMEVLQQAEDFHDLIVAYGRRAAAQGVRRFEMFFDPQAHTRRGVALQVAIEGLEAGLATLRRENALSAGLIACIVRDAPLADAGETLEELLRLHSPSLLGVGLDSVEVGFPPSLFVDLFARARAEGLRVTAHAGEEAGPDYVWQALHLLKVERIDHGVRSNLDPHLVADLRNRAMPLTTCPLSNVRLGVFSSMREHSLAGLLRAGCNVTINSDGPAYFGGYAGDNYIAAAEALALSRAELVTLARNSVLAAFMSVPERRALLAELNAFVETTESRTHSANVRAD